MLRSRYGDHMSQHDSGPVPEGDSDKWDDFFRTSGESDIGLSGGQGGAVADAMARYQDELMRYPNVVGVAPGHRLRDGEPDDEQCLVVYVTNKVPESELGPGEVIPKRIGEVGVDVVGVGEIKPFSD